MSKAQSMWFAQKVSHGLSLSQKYVAYKALIKSENPTNGLYHESPSYELISRIRGDIWCVMGQMSKPSCFLIQQFLCRQPTEDGTYRDRMQLSSSPLLMISRYGYVSPQPCFANFVTPVHAWALFIYFFFCTKRSFIYSNIQIGRLCSLLHTTF